MPQVNCPKCGRLMLSIQDKYCCINCELYAEIDGARKVWATYRESSKVTEEDREFLKKIKVKWS